MSTQWNVSFKPALLRDVTALPPKEMHQVMAKITLLIENPEPQANVKKFLKYLSGGEYGLYRLRSGDYRIFYTFSSAKRSISLLAINALPHQNLPHLSSKPSSLLFFVDCATRSQARSWSLTKQKTGGPVNDKRTIGMRHGETSLSPQVEAIPIPASTCA